MKKLLAILVVFALFASTAFAADVVIGGWGRADFVPLMVDIPDGGDNTTSSVTRVSWGGGPALGANITVDGGEIGFFGSWAFNLDVGGVNLDGKGYVWWQPLDIFRLSIGRIEEDALRGGFGPESWAGGFCGIGDFGEDLIFNRFNTADANYGAVLKLTPIEGLTVGAALQTNGSGGEEIGDVFKNGQYGLGYDIAGIGFARFGYFGGAKKIQVAFKLTAVENVGLDFGFTYFTDPDLADADDNIIQVVLGGSVGIGDINVWFGVNGLFGGDKDKGHPGILQFGVNPEFALGDIGNVGLGFYIKFAFVDDAKADLGFDLYLKKGYGSGQLKVGVAAAIAGSGDVKIAVPIEIEYWF